MVVGLNSFNHNNNIRANKQLTFKLNPAKTAKSGGQTIEEILKRQRELNEKAGANSAGVLDRAAKRVVDVIQGNKKPKKLDKQV